MFRLKEGCRSPERRFVGADRCRRNVCLARAVEANSANDAAVSGSGTGLSPMSGDHLTAPGDSRIRRKAYAPEGAGKREQCVAVPDS